MANILCTLSILLVVVSHYGCQGSQQFSKFKTKLFNLGSQSDTSTEIFPVFISPQDGLKETDKIERLPGQPDGVDFNQYSGHVTVDPIAGRALFYYFVESPQNPQSKPLLLWLNGEFGCSSFGIGAMTELGPFRVNSDGKTLYRNPYAWNSEANIIFLEVPIGVGFSYSNTSSDYQLLGDNNTVHDSYTFLVNWLERFPEYKSRDFFIAGTITSARIVIQLARLILRANEYSNQTLINVRGIAVGNPNLDYESVFKGTSDYAWTHALISDEIHSGLKLYCTDPGADPNSDKCNEFFNLMYNVTYGPYGINEFDIYSPTCNYTPRTDSMPGYGPCSTNYVLEYLHNPQVQIALHANMGLTIPYPWEIFNYTVNYSWNYGNDTMLPNISLLMEHGIRVWIYSGDVNSEMPVTSTRYAINKLQLSIKTPWFPWYLQNEVAGYVVQYQNLTFVTVRGAGIFVAYSQPARALALFTSFISGNLPPSGHGTS